MATSQARIEANRRNSLLSTGPTSVEGKRISRKNSYKHGMTGRGIVVEGEDAREIAGRFEEFEAELRPRGGYSRFLVQQAAMMSVRIERCQRQEAGAIAEKVRNAGEAFDDARLAEVEHLFDWIASTPETNARRLRQTPEGVDRLLKALRGLMLDLVHPTRFRWEYGHVQRLENIMGRRPEDFPISDAGRYHKVAIGDRSYLDEGEAEGLEGEALKGWALEHLAQIMEAEIEALERLRESFDGDRVELDREGAGRRALFDPSKEATLARRYEAAATREFHRSIRDLREAEEAMAERGGRPEAREEPAALGSSGRGGAGAGDPIETFGNDDDSAGLPWGDGPSLRANCGGEVPRVAVDPVLR